MIDTDKYKCSHCKNEHDENDVWHDVIDLQLWKMTSICDGRFEEDGGYRYKNSADIEGLIAEVKRLREALITVQQSLVWDEKDRAMDGDPITLEALVTQVERVRRDITEMKRNE
tara:strand:+ start:95 stop:436 length:342 start_codon:yes stop_codon:yes gene_type:complete